MDPLVYVAPLFVLGLLVEGFALRSYALRPFLSALGCVALDQLAGTFSLSVFLGAFDAAHRRLAVVSLAPDALSTWAMAVLAHDLAYYAFHRASHRVTVLWAAHVVHHQSESYDFTVSLRQGTVATWVSYVFYAPLALAFDARTFVLVHAAYQVWQFFVHTRAVSRMGALEWVFATPSHHRVHHGRERQHLDKNYGGFFIVFDRLFGTFAPETREPRYGVPGGYDVVSPLFANTYVFARLIDASRRAGDVRSLARIWLGPPERNARWLSSAGHAPRPNERPSRVRAVAPFAIGGALAAMVAARHAALPAGVVALAIVGAVVLLEAGSRYLDGR